MLKVCSSAWGAYPVAFSSDHKKVVILDTFTSGDNVLYLWEEGSSELRLLQGIPLEQRFPDQSTMLLGITGVNFAE